MELTRESGVEPASGVKPVPGPVVQIDEGCIQAHLTRWCDRQSKRHWMRSRAGVVTLTGPKLRSLSFETAIIERYRRRESSVEEALTEVYLARVSVH